MPFILLDKDNVAFRATEIAEYNGKLKATAEKEGNIGELLKNVEPLLILWLN